LKKRGGDGKRKGGGMKIGKWDWENGLGGLGFVEEEEWVGSGTEDLRKERISWGGGWMRWRWVMGE
jgi:hypothetical protein